MLYIVVCGSRAESTVTAIWPYGQVLTEYTWDYYTHRGFLRTSKSSNGGLSCCWTTRHTLLIELMLQAGSLINAEDGRLDLSASELKKTRLGPRGIEHSDMEHSDIVLVGGEWLPFISFFSWILGMSNHPNWRTHIFQRGGPTTNQIFIVCVCCSGNITL